MFRARGGGGLASAGTRAGVSGRGAAGKREANADPCWGHGGSSRARSAADVVADRIIHDIGESNSSSDDDDSLSSQRHRNPTAAAAAAGAAAAAAATGEDGGVRKSPIGRAAALAAAAAGRGGKAAVGWAARRENAPLTLATSRAATNSAFLHSPDSSPGSPGDAPLAMNRGRCAFNQVKGCTRRCRGGRLAAGLCEGCERVRDRWTARLMTEFQVGMSRSQIHLLLNRFMDLNKSREHLRNLQESRSPKISCSQLNASAPSEPAQQLFRQTEHTGANQTAALAMADKSDADTACLPKESLPSPPISGICTPEAKPKAERRCLQPQKKSPVHDLLTLFSASAHTAAGGEVCDEEIQAVEGKTPLPVGFCLCGIRGGGMKEVWRKQGVKCWVCGSETVAEDAAVAAMVIGGISVESRSRSVSRYGGLPCVPVLTCGCKGCDGVGRSQALSAIWWCSEWVSVPDFLVIPGGGEEYIEAAEGACRERVILQILHWFSKTHEDPEDRHACFLPPPLDRDCAIVCRDSVACSYSTLTLEADNGFALPTLHTIFVKASHRRMGCAQQLLLGFFRPPGGRFRRRKASLCTSEEAPQPSERPPLSTKSLEFGDRLGIEPPVSDALILTMAKIFSLTELANIMMLFSGVPLSAAKNAKSVLGHMRSKEALQKQEANTPLRRIRAGREGRTQIRSGRGGGGSGVVARG